MLGGKHKIKIDGELYRLLGELAEKAGYASTDEFIHHVLEREAKEAREKVDKKEAEKQLRGLGYLE